MLNKETIDLLKKPFDAKDIKKRQGSFGKTLDYIEGHKVIQRLNSALGMRWSFEIVNYTIDNDHVIVHGVIAVPVLDEKGNVTDVIRKHAFGGKKVNRAKLDGRPMIDLGADIKAATTDALKKAATLLGVGLDLYGADDDDIHEAKEAAKETKKDEPVKKASDAQKKALATICTTQKLVLNEVLAKFDTTLDVMTESKAKEIISSLNRS